MRTLRFLIIILAIAGLVDSVLALRIHDANPNDAPPCTVSANWDCGTVNHSRYAVFPPISFSEAPNSTKFHFPVATIGIIGYALLIVAAAANKPWIMLQLAEIGFFCAALLSYMEAFVLEKWCIYCVWSQGLITAILICAIIAVVWRRRAAAV